MVAETGIHTIYMTLLSVQFIIVLNLCGTSVFLPAECLVYPINTPYRNENSEKQFIITSKVLHRVNNILEK